MTPLTLVRNPRFDAPSLETGNLCLGYKRIRLIFNAGPFPGGGNCILAECDGLLTSINSNDLVHDLPAYRIGAAVRTAPRARIRSKRIAR